MLSTHQLTYQYKKGEKTFCFPDIQLQPKEHLLILGKSGIGKTTLLHLIAGLLPPTSGEIRVGDVSLSKLTFKETEQFRGQQMGFVFQKKHALASLSILEHLKTRLFFAKKSIRKKQIDELLQQLDLSELMHKKSNELSEGQLQRLSIALAVVHQPKLLLADEPTSSLDDINCKKGIQLLLNQATQNQANLIVITHDKRIKPYFSKSTVL